jgi:hypothetical protein
LEDRNLKKNPNIISDQFHRNPSLPRQNKNVLPIFHVYERENQDLYELRGFTLLFLEKGKPKLIFTRKFWNEVVQIWHLK